MSYYQRIFSHILISLSFTFVWVGIFTYHFFGVGEFLGFGYYDSDFAVIAGGIIPFLLLFLVLYFKSSLAYGLVMLFFAVMILVLAAQLPILIELHLNGPSDQDDRDIFSIIVTSPFMIDLKECIKNLAYSCIGFSLMNTKTLLQVYSWDTKKSRQVFFIATLLYLLTWIFLRFL